MADFDLSSVLGAPALTGAIKARTTGVPNPFPESFFKQHPEDEVVKDYGTFYRYYGQRKTAQLNAYGNPSRNTQQLNMEGVPVKLLHTVHSINIPMSKMRGLISKDSTGSNLRIDEKGAEEIKRQVEEFGALFQNLRIAAMAYAISTDAIYWDAGGNLLPNSSGSLFSIKSGVPANNQGQLNGIINIPWGDSNSNIEVQLESLDQVASKLTGYKLRYAFYGKNIRSYLMNATNLIKYFQFNQAVNTQLIATNQIPELLGKSWQPVYEAQYDDKNGTTQFIFGDNQCVFTPDPEKQPGWISFLEGTYDVPTEIGRVGANGLDLLGNIKPMTGMFAYAVINTDPLAIKIVMGDTFLPVIKVPQSIFQSTVQFSS